MSEFSHTEEIHNRGNDLDKLTEQACSLVKKLSEQRKEYALKASHAEWHVRGLNYHHKRVYGCCRRFAAEFGKGG